ncbi:MAG TPA: arginine--tRNA ligase, partial [Patescibacteria group bacterium]|nr:arginine--tRNA ligase [Patescibacteria group bacterium]
MTSARQFWTETIAKRLTTQLGTPISQNEIVTPPDKNLGDFAFGCFRLAKEQKKKPNEIANQIASGFDGSALEIASVSAAGPYVNFTLKTGEAVHRVICDIEQAKDSYGQNTSGQNQELLLEYATLNTHKEAHVGHVRVLSLGAALGHLLETNGWKVIRNSYLGDVGAHVAKCLWHLVKKNGFNPNQFGIQDADKLLHGIIKEQRTGRFLGETYAESTRAMENDPEAKQEVSLVLKNLEAHDPAWEKLWKETRRWSLDELSAIFEELGTQRIDKQYLESDVVDRGQAIVDELLKKGIAKISQGAVIVDLEDVGLGVFLIRKSDGSTLYATKDLALAEQKAKDFPNYARALFVVDNRQSFYFKQLFETLKRMGFSKRQEFVGFEFVTLKAGAMSSREGNVVTY